jgi:hypothetical protein
MFDKTTSCLFFLLDFPFYLCVICFIVKKFCYG